MTATSSIKTLAATITAATVLALPAQALARRNENPTTGTAPAVTALASTDSTGGNDGFRWADAAAGAAVASALLGAGAATAAGSRRRRSGGAAIG
ncbi:MAG TPA: hypothetical protein VH025_04075 [Solirubrobacteraceae bacterium]|jgi:hypothetical protein|nr:hypothetical protein [Solirubrobacteraceae bacterium]